MGTDPRRLAGALAEVRRATESLAAPLSAEDQMVQSMPDASPTKWHLAHTTWFFETFVLAPRAPGYRVFDARFGYLFNSYYESVGPRHSRPARGLLSRPSLAEVKRYRAHVDEALGRFLREGAPDAATLAVIELGLHHEQQHQELVLTDIKHALAQSPLAPAYRADAAPAAPGDAPPLSYVAVEGGLVEVGHAGEGFAFDNEGPRHRAYLRPFALGSRPVTCGEVLDFIADGGYRRPTLWLSAGFEAVTRGGWTAPLYWEERDGAWWQFTLGGPRPVERAAPACHVSYYEADAVARWMNARLPTEQEWERAAADVPVAGSFVESGRLHPAAATTPAATFAQLYGEVWQWTASAYAPYPGFVTAPGALGEYNGKFMVGQMVLRGGSCASPRAHLRATYRNFFPPDARWQFSGIRLARDA
ncbi:MAG TPA: ergothioneine biosynthesis protein EgtB [Polyangia bacterium]|nr:ergothioneine biosynthesis protein EgtB [Polyangia bacterium]